MRKLTLEADILHNGSDTKIIIRLGGPGIPEDVQQGEIYIILRDYKKYSNRSLFDGLMFMFLFVAMKDFDIFEVKGPISRKALRNARVFQEAWACMLPNLYHVCEIQAQKVIEPSFFLGVKSPAAISAFSGGLDATFLAIRQTGHEDWCYPLKSCVMVHGFDVWFEDDDAFERLVRRVDPLLEDVKLKRFIVKTNIRKFELQNWEHSFASQLAGILHLFYKSHSTALIGSSEPYNNLVFPWGSTPATDYLLSGEKLEVIHEGAGFSRTEKAEIVAKHSVGRETLKVCWQGSDQATNCGHCEKCVRTRLNFKAVGLDDAPCFSTPFEEGMISDISVRNVAQLTELVTISDFCHARKLSGTWIDKLDCKIDEIRRVLASPERT